MSKYLIFGFIFSTWVSIAHAQFGDEINIFASFSPSAIDPGEFTTFSWSASGGNGNAISCTFSGLPGLTFGEGTGSIQITSQETLQVDVFCENIFAPELPIPSGFASAVLTVNADPVTPEPTVDSSFSPADVAVGQQTVFSWSSTNASSCSSTGVLSINGISGSVPFVPAVVGDQSVTVTCTGPGGTASSTSILSVGRISVFAAYSPSILTAPGFSTLLWGSINTDFCSIGGLGIAGTSGTFTSFFSFSRSTTVVCFGPGGVGVASAFITVLGGFSGEENGKRDSNPDTPVEGLMRVVEDSTSSDAATGADLSVDKIMLEELGVHLADENMSSLAIDLNADEIEDRLVFAPESRMLFVLISDHGEFTSIGKSVRDVSALSEVKSISVDSNGLIEVQVGK